MKEFALFLSCYLSFLHSFHTFDNSKIYSTYLSLFLSRSHFGLKGECEKREEKRENGMRKKEENGNPKEHDNTWKSSSLVRRRRKKRGRLNQHTNHHHHESDAWERETPSVMKDWWLIYKHITQREGEGDHFVMIRVKRRQEGEEWRFDKRNTRLERRSRSQRGRKWRLHINWEGNWEATEKATEKGIGKGRDGMKREKM